MSTKDHRPRLDSCELRSPGRTSSQDVFEFFSARALHLKEIFGKKKQSQNLARIRSVAVHMSERTSDLSLHSLGAHRTPAIASTYVCSPFIQNPQSRRLRGCAVRQGIPQIDCSTAPSESSNTLQNAVVQARFQARDRVATF